MPSIRLLTGDPGSIDTDLLVIPAFDGEAAAGAIADLDAASGGEGGRAFTSGENRGRLYDFFLTPTAAKTWKAARLAIAGAGKSAEFTTERLRKLASAAALAARTRRIARVAFLLRAPWAGADAVQAAAE